MKKLFVVFAVLFVLTACGGKETVIINADYLVEEYVQQIPKNIPPGELTEYTDEYDLFITGSELYSQYVVFSANTEVDDFKFYVIAVPRGDIIEYHKGKPILHYDKLSENRSLIIRMPMPETLPWYGISYTDENGDTINYAIHCSGKDGSVILEKFE